MHKNARSKAHKCRIRHKGFNLGADFGMERVLITNGHLARFPRPIPSAPKIMDFQSYFQSFEMSPDVTVQVHLFGHLNDNSTLPTDASLAGLGEPPFCFRFCLPSLPKKHFRNEERSQNNGKQFDKKVKKRFLSAIGGRGSNMVSAIHVSDLF